MRIFILAFLFLSTLYSLAQDEQTFEKIIGSGGNEQFLDLTVLSDQSLVLAGWTESKGKGSKDIWLVKLSNSQNIAWEKTYGDYKVDYCASIINKNNFEYYLTGAKENASTGYMDVYIMNLDNFGEQEWEKTFIGSQFDKSKKIIAAEDKGFITVGTKEAKGDHLNRVWILKTDKRGRRLWQGAYGNDYENAEGNDLLITKDGHYIAVGFTQPTGGNDKNAFVVKGDMRSNLVWSKSFGGDFDEIANSVTASFENGYIIVGQKWKSLGDADIYIMKIDHNGNVIWEKTISRPGNNSAITIIPANDRNYIIAANTQSGHNGKFSVWLAKINEQADIIWDVNYGKYYSNFVNTLLSGQDNTYYLCGYIQKTDKASQDAWLLKFNDPPADLIANADINRDINGGVDEQPPEITIIEPRSKDYIAIDVSQVKVKGIVKDNVKVKQVLINNKQAMVSQDGLFEATILLNTGANIITIKAIDNSNNIASKEIQLIKGEQVASSSSDTEDFDFTFTAHQSKYYALLIGVEDYQDPDINDLDNPIEDALSLKTALVKNYTFDDENVIVLQNPTRADIIVALDELSQKITKDDNLLVFYAGHGYWDEDKNLGYWLPSDAGKSNTAFWLRNSTIRDYIGSIKSKHTLLIADACFSGGIFKTRNAFSDAPKAVNKLYELNSRKAMTSGTLKEVPDQSVFIEYLVKRLEDNAERYVTSEDLFRSFRIAVLNNSPNVPQYGTIQNAGDEGGDFIFIKK